MNKKTLIAKIVAHLSAKVALYAEAARAAHAEATHEESKAEDKYDTRGLEASYLAQGQSRQMADMEEALVQFQRLTPRPFGESDAIDIGALVELSSPTDQTLYFIGPSAGGTEVVQEKRTVLVLTPQSPLGQQLVGKTQGARLKMKLAGRPAELHITQVR